MTTLRDLRRSSGAMRCMECGKCSTLCPLSTFRDFSVARMAAIHDPGGDLASHAQPISRCLTCGACELRCPQNVQFTHFVRGLRGAMPTPLRGQCPHGTVLQSAARLMAQSNGSLHRDLSWIGDGLRVAEKGDVALFVGCLPLFDVVFQGELGIRTIEIARSAIKLLNAAGIEPVIVGEERCCGHDLLWNGEEDIFNALAKANAEAFAARGVKHIVAVCAECTRTWKVDYANAVPDYKPKVEHIAEFLSGGQALLPVPSSDERTGKSACPTRVTYQDPCRLARHLGVVDAPRQLIGKTGAELVEMEHTGIDAKCCGTAGFIHCDADSRRMQDERLRSAAATGAEVLLTACPKCWIHFSCTSHEDGLRARGRPQIAVEDLTMFVERSCHSERSEESPSQVGGRSPAVSAARDDSQRGAHS